jgi:hypothetical protein
MSHPIAQLEKRMLGRSGTAVAPLLWELTFPPDAGIARAVLKAGANWFLLPASVPIDAIKGVVAPLTALDGVRIVVGTTAEELITRTRRAEVLRIEALAPLRCAAVMVQSADLSQMKSGGPFHRTGNLRQQAKCEFVFAEASSAADADWIISNSPAHAVSVPFGIADQSAGFGVLALGEELGTAIIAHPPQQAIWKTDPPAPAEEISFVLSYPQVAMAIAPFPRSIEEAQELLFAASAPIDAAQRQQLWSRFQEAVKPPPKPRAGHAPEYGA